MLVKKIFVIMLSLLLSCALPAYAADRLDPFTAELTVIPGKTSAWSDIRATLDVYIHNGDEGSLVGSKFVCMQDIESINVTDGDGHRLPFTLKSYPRKRIMWEYGPSKKGVRRAMISFVIRNAVKREGEACTMDVDWVSGWNREVLNATYSIVLPDNVSENDLVSVSPSKYKFAKSDKGGRITYTFPVLDTKTVRVVYKNRPGPAVSKTQEKKDESEIKAPVNNDAAPAKIQNAKEKPSSEAADRKIDSQAEEDPAKQTDKEQVKEPEKDSAQEKEKDKSLSREAAQGKYSISNIRSAPNETKDRLVFDINKKIPYDISYPPAADEFEILWNAPVEVSNKAIDKKKISAGLIKGVRWKKSADKKLSTIVQLQKKDLKIKYGNLENPPRFYVDVFNASDEKTDDTMLKPKTKVEATPEPKAAIKSSDNKTPAEALILQLQKEIKTDNVTSPAPEVSSPAHPSAPANDFVSPPAVPGSVSKISSIEEKLSYTKAKKLFEVKEYENAISAFEGFLTKYPGTIMKEEILFDLAEANYRLAEQREPKNYNDTITSYKKALTNFPEATRAPYAAFQIAECHRKGEFYIEASSQYNLVLERYPSTPYGIESRFWMAECYFQMRKFEDALKEFEKFVNDFPTGPHAREASFRIADCYAEIKDFDRAEFYYEKALKRWPDMSDLQVKTLNNMAMTNYYKGKFEKARELLFLSFNLYPSQETREQHLRFIGDSYQWEGEMQKALNMYALLMDLFPESEENAIAVMRIADLGVNVAGLDAEQFKFKNFSPYKDPEKAYQWITENAKTREVLTEAMYKLGFTLAKQGKYGDAVELFKKSMTQKNDGMYFAKSFENIQKILTRMIHMASEKEDYFSVVELYKKNETVFLNNANDCSFFY
ncbi:MAG: tetratricopeptide repeat protein, partial [Pseudomonadota bacterium]